MSRSRTGTTLSAAALTALFAGPLAAGVVFQVETTYHSGSGSGGPQGSEMSVEAPNLKMEILPSSESEDGAPRDVAIWRGDRREMVVVDHGDQAYIVFDKDTVAEVGGQVSDQMQQAMKELEKQLEGLDPKQREMMEKMLKDRMPPGAGAGVVKRQASEFRRTGERATKAGYPCVRYDVWRDGEKIREMWVTDWGNIEGGGEVKDVYKDVAGFFREMMDALGEMMGGSAFGDGDSPFDGFDEIDGFPVVTRSFEDGELESEMTLRSARRRTLDPAAFEPPAGYKRRSMLGGN